MYKVNTVYLQSIWHASRSIGSRCVGEITQTCRATLPVWVDLEDRSTKAVRVRGQPGQDGPPSGGFSSMERRPKRSPVPKGVRSSGPLASKWGRGRGWYECTVLYEPRVPGFKARGPYTRRKWAERMGDTRPLAVEHNLRLCRGDRAALAEYIQLYSAGKHRE